MSELLKKAEALNQSPSISKIIDIVQEIARKIEVPEDIEPEVKKVDVDVKSVVENTVKMIDKKPKKKKK